MYRSRRVCARTCVYTNNVDARVSFLRGKVDAAFWSPRRPARSTGPGGAPGCCVTLTVTPSTCGGLARAECASQTGLAGGGR